MELLEQADISMINTLALPSKARLLIDTYTVEELTEVSKKYSLLAEDILILGGGSNLVLPAFLDRIVIRYLGQSIRYQETDTGEVLVSVDAGVVWDELVNKLVNKGLRGIENLSLIPGTVGAAPVQNIGAYGVELADVLESVEVFNIEKQITEILSKKQCEFSYRDSLFKQNPNKYFILNVCLKVSAKRDFSLSYGELQSLNRNSDLSVHQVREKVISLRQAKLPDPKKLPNTGSFFKNPVVTAEQAIKLKAKFPEIVAYPQAGGRVKLAAGWMIDQSGWKGVRSGNVGMHSKQALVLVNYAHATQIEVLSFAAKIQSSILEKFNVVLEIEPVVIKT